MFAEYCSSMQHRALTLLLSWNRSKTGLVYTKHAQNKGILASQRVSSFLEVRKIFKSNRDDRRQKKFKNPCRSVLLWQYIVFVTSLKTHRSSVYQARCWSFECCLPEPSILTNFPYQQFQVVDVLDIVTYNNSVFLLTMEPLKSSLHALKNWNAMHTTQF